MDTSYLYKITNKINGKCYIGVSKDPYSRFKAHCQKQSTCTKLRNAILKHGPENFEMVVLCKGSLDYISDLEDKAIEKYNSREDGYNILFGHHKKNLKLPPEVSDAISKSLYKFYENNECKNLGKKFDKCYNDNPVYVLGFWFPSVRFCTQVFGKHCTWVMNRNGSEQEYIPKRRTLRKDCKYTGPVYVGGFWWPDLNVASDKLKISKSTLVARLDRGYVEEYSTAMSEGKKGKLNPMAGKFGSLHPMSRKVRIEGVVYGSIAEAVRITGYTKSQIEKRITKEKYPDFSYA